MDNDPLHPSPQLLCKLGSLIVHADEMLSPGGNNFDRQSIIVGLADPDVKNWLKKMDAMAMLPKKRKEPSHAPE